MEDVSKQLEYDGGALMVGFMDLGFVGTEMEGESFDLGEYCFGVECFPKSKNKFNFKNQFKLLLVFAIAIEIDIDF